MCSVVALVDWLQVPLGQAPLQTLDSTSLELPIQLDNEPTLAQNNGTCCYITECFEYSCFAGQFTPRLGAGVLSSPLYESTIMRKRKFDQTDLAKIHTYSDTMAKI